MDKEKFWDNVSAPDKNGCRNWLRGKGGGNPPYGHVWWKDKCMSAHRVAWELTNGYIPSNLSVLHKCDNTLCCNPNHLYLGTQADNVADMYSKNRQPNRAGSACGHARLSESEVLCIRWMKTIGFSQIYLARVFDVTESQISLIVNRKRWKHI